MIADATEEMHGSDRVPDLRRLRCEPWLDRQFFNESEMALFSECTVNYALKVLDAADIVREAMFRQRALRGRGRGPAAAYLLFSDSNSPA
jgi:hypothetical protein